MGDGDDIHLGIECRVDDDLVFGLEVLRGIRGTHSRSELPVIMATVLDRSEDIVEALRHGANDYVTKPFDYPVVLARVDTQLALKRAAEAPQRVAHYLALSRIPRLK